MSDEPGRGVDGSRILVAEDEPIIAMWLEEELRGAGFQVTLADDGLAALDALPTAAFDLVLTDLNMPRLDGVGLVRRLGEVRPELPVVVLSGCVTPRHRSAFQRMRAPPRAILEKPVLFPELQDAIRAALRAAAVELARKRGGEATT